MVWCRVLCLLSFRLSRRRPPSVAPTRVQRHLSSLPRRCAVFRPRKPKAFASTANAHASALSIAVVCQYPPPPVPSPVRSTASWPAKCCANSSGRRASTRSTAWATASRTRRALRSCRHQHLSVCAHCTTKRRATMSRATRAGALTGRGTATREWRATGCSAHTGRNSRGTCGSNCSKSG